MKEYLERAMHQSVDEWPYENTAKLPVTCRDAFELNIIKLDNTAFLFAAPINDLYLTQLRIMRLQLERNTGYTCVFYLKKVNWYAASKMIEEEIPFVWENHQVYLPSLGLLLKETAQKIPKRWDGITFLTQKLLLKALYENWQNVTAAQAAERLGVSRMSVTRCYNEIESLGLPFLTKDKRSRYFRAAESKKEMWTAIRPFLRNPVIRIFRPERKPKADMILSGTSALAQYSMLEDEGCITYAVKKYQISAIGLKEIQEVPMNENPACIVQEVGYILSFGDNKFFDPLSLSLMLTEEDLADPRVESSLKAMMEEVWNSPGLPKF